MRRKGSKSQDDAEIRNILLAVALLMGFIFIVSVVIYFIKEHYGLVCTCSVSLPLVIATLTSLGVVVGILTYYFLSKAYSKEKEKFYGDVEKTLNFLDKEEKTILSTLIKNDGKVSQSRLSELTSIDAVKLHRRLVNLESKDIVHKVKNGMSNMVVLDKEFREIFIK